MREVGMRRAHGHCDAMLRITVHEDGGVCRVELIGRLEGPWVVETELAWRSALRSGREIELDIRELIAVDGAGRELLSVMHQSGARFVVRGIWTTALMEEIAGGRPLDGADRRGPRGFPAKGKTGNRRHTQ
jgi:hypothetical protein